MPARRALTALLGCFCAAPSLAADLVILRDGSRRTGQLQACVADRCGLEGQSIERAAIGWVGFGVEAAANPPAPSQMAEDEVHLAPEPGERRRRAPGRVEVAEVVGVSLGEVATVAGSFERGEVRWIHFGAEEPGAPDGVGGVVDEPQPPPPPPVRPPPPPPPAACPPNCPTSSSPGVAQEPGGLWIGTVQGRHSFDDGYTSESRSITVQVRLREVAVIAADAKVPYRNWLFQDEGSVLSEIYDLHEPQTQCSGQGSTAARSAGGGRVEKLQDVDLTPMLGYDWPRGRARYSFSIYPAGDHYEPACRGFHGTWKNHAGFFGVPNIGRHANADAGFPADPEIRYLEGGRMVGSYTGAHADKQVWMSWSICRQGENCPPPAALPPAGGGIAPPPGPCDETRADRAQLDLRMDQLRALLEAVQNATAEYGRIEEQAAQWQDDFNQATWDCRLWSVARMLASFLISNWAPTVGGRALAPAPGRPDAMVTAPYEPGKAFANVVSMLEKVLDDEGSWILPDHEFDAIFGASAEDVWDGFNMGLNAIGSSAPQDLKAGLQTCGAPTLNEVLDGAYEYLRLLEQVKPLADRMHTLMNNASDLDESIFDFCLSHAEACAAYPCCR